MVVFPLWLFILSCASLSASHNGRRAGEMASLVAQLQFQDSVVCTATILSRTWLLSTARCTAYRRTSGFSVRCGTTLRRGSGFVLRVNLIVEHEHFEGYTNYTNTLVHPVNDVSLLRTIKALPSFEEVTVRPAKLPWPNDDHLPPGVKVSVVGWARASATKTPPVWTLRQVDVSVSGPDTCSEPWENTTTFCVRQSLGAPLACDAHAGDAAFLGDVIVGMVSFAIDCHRPQQATVMVRMAAFSQWIVDTIADAPTSH